MATVVHVPIWQLQEAKNRLSEVINAAETSGPQTITRHGEPVAMIVPIISGAAASTISVWDLLRDERVAKLGGPPTVPPRAVDPAQAVPLPW